MYLCVFSVDHMETLLGTEQYIEQIRRIKKSNDVPIILVGNKIDLPRRKVDTQLGRCFARQRKMAG